MAPSPSISDLANAAESALAQYNNDQTTVSSDQAKITSLQTQLAADQATAAADGAAAFTAVGTLITALQSVQANLPHPSLPAIPVV